MFDFAILGGAFNPIHNGHLYIANEVIKQGIAEEVIFMPNGNHPLKNTSLLLPYQHRFHLIELAIENKSEFMISKLDSPEYGISYTYNLIQRISKDFSLSQFTFLIGYDNALNFSEWYKPEWLLENVNFTVVSRNTSSSETSHLDKRFTFLKIPPYDISSSEIRDKLARGEDISKLIPPQIFDQLQQYWRILSQNQKY